MKLFPIQTKLPFVCIISLNTHAYNLVNEITKLSVPKHYMPNPPIAKTADKVMQFAVFILSGKPKGRGRGSSYTPRRHSASKGPRSGWSIPFKSRTFLIQRVSVNVSVQHICAIKVVW